MIGPPAFHPLAKTAAFTFAKPANVEAPAGDRSRLSRQVGSGLEFTDAGLGCLDLVDRLGPLSPSAR
jgi:hypothetical protein